MFGCGLPSLIFLKDKSKAMRVGIGMVSRGEVGLIVAGVGATFGGYIWRCIYCNYCYGSSNYNNHTNMA